MKAMLKKLEAGYQAVMEDFLAGGGEAALQRAYELVHEAIRDGLGLMHLVTIHKELLFAILSKASSQEECVKITKASHELFSECLVAFEFTHRGFRESRQILQVLREGEKRLRELADAMPQLVWTADPDGRIDYFNRRLMEFNHQKGMRSAIHPEDWQRTSEAWKRGVHSEAGYQIEHRLQRSDGSFRWFLSRAVPVRDEAGRVTKWYGTSTDIDDHRQAEEKVLRAKQEWEQTFDTVPDLIAILDTQHQIVRVNKALADRLGVHPQHCRGISCYEAIHGLSNPPAFCPHIKTCRDGQEHVVEVYEPRLGGNFLVSTTPLCDPDGRLVGAVHVCRDISELKRAEDLLRRSEAALLEANEYLEQRVRERTMDLQNLTTELEKSRDDLRRLASELVLAEERERKRIATILHDEICQTLAVAKMRIDMLQKMAADGESRQIVQEAKDFITQSVQETRALMNNIGNPLLFDMGVAAACESLADRLMANHPIQIYCDIRDSFKELSPEVKVILFQVIRELLNNVIKHSGARNARIIMHRKDGRIRATVKDDGRGFDPQKLGAPTSEGGFGLFSIRERLMAFNGALQIESSPGTGTAVTATLPAVLDPSTGTEGDESG